MKTLSELDVSYKAKTEKFSNEEREKYCYELIDRFQNIVAKNKNFLSDKLKKEFEDLINAAQTEIKKINKI